MAGVTTAPKKEADPTPAPSVDDRIASLMESQEKQSQAIDRLAQLLSGPSDGSNVPFARTGEDPMSSRGYSFLKMVGLVAGHVQPEDAKVEMEVNNRLQKHYVQATGYKKHYSNSVVTPFSCSHLISGETESDRRIFREISDVVRAGLTDYDPAELAYLRGRMSGMTHEKALSWLNTTSGAALVAPPVMGELIDIFRNNEALIRAGARDIGMPPSGRIVFPRQTGVSTGYWVGENAAITESQPSTGDLTLVAKKLGVLVKIPNELYRFATIAAEAFVREDIARTMALTLDDALLEGDAGSTTRPKGLITYAGIQSHTASTTSANGDTFEPEDVGLMVAKVEERNAIFNGWIMRPLMYTRILNRRVSAIAAGDGEGPFVFDRNRSLREMMDRGRGVGELEGYSVIKSTQVSNTRTKGSGTDLTYILGGDFTDYVMAMGGIVEFLVANQGDTMITNDQTWVRGIQYVDGAPRHEASFILCDDLVVN